jgi:hypothetical protein
MIQEPDHLAKELTNADIRSSSTGRCVALVSELFEQSLAAGKDEKNPSERRSV